MPLYMDVHRLGEPVSVDDVAKAHLADLEHQDKYDVKYLRYWVDEDQGRDLLPGRGAVPGRRQHRPQGSPRPGRRRGAPGPGGVVTPGCRLVAGRHRPAAAGRSRPCMAHARPAAGHHAAPRLARPPA